MSFVVFYSLVGNIVFVVWLYFGSIWVKKVKNFDVWIFFIEIVMLFVKGVFWVLGFEKFFK